MFVYERVIMMKLLDMVKHPEWITVDNLYALKECLDNRRDWLEERARVIWFSIR